MTKEQKATLLGQKLQIANVLRFALRSKVLEVISLIEEEQLDEYLTSISAYQATIQYKIEEAIAEGNKIMVEFTTENIMLGITQDNMTKTVRRNLSEVIMCIVTGSLYDAIDEIKNLPSEKKDPKYLNDARLLTFVNKLETYLQIPLSPTL